MSISRKDQNSYNFVKESIDSASERLRSICKELRVFPPHFTPDQIEKLIKKEITKLNRASKEMMRKHKEDLNE